MSVNGFELVAYDNFLSILRSCFEGEENPKQVYKQLSETCKLFQRGLNQLKKSLFESVLHRELPLLRCYIGYLKERVGTSSSDPITSLWKELLKSSSRSNSRSNPYSEILALTNAEEVEQKLMQNEQESALSQVWPTMLKEIQKANPQTAIPDYLYGCSNNDKRKWLQENASLVANVTELDFSYKGLKVIPSEIGLFVGLKNLNVKSNQLVTVPAEIGNLKDLKYLRLSENKLIQIPTPIGNLKNLEELLLDNNHLRKIPAEIGELEKLKELTLGCNQLIEIPREIGNLKRLTHLSLNDNLLMTIPAEIGNLPSLLHLSLDHNQLKFLPEEICGIKTLKWLYLQHNRLPVLPKLQDLPSLKLLDVRNNQLKWIAKELERISDLKTESNPLYVNLFKQSAFHPNYLITGFLR